MTTPDTSKVAAQVAMRRIFPRLDFQVRSDGGNQFWLDYLDENFRVTKTRPASHVEWMLFREREDKAAAILALIADKGTELHAAETAAEGLVQVVEFCLRHADEIGQADLKDRQAELKRLMGSPIHARRSYAEIVRGMKGGSDV